MLTRRAPALRAAGILEVSISALGDLDAKLAPAAPEPRPADDEDARSPVITDPLKDPATFGGFMPRSLYRDDADD